MRRLLQLFIITLICLQLISCGGGGESPTPEATSTVSPETTNTVSVFLTKAPINGATCNLHDTNDQVVAGPVISNAGVIQFTAVSYTGDAYTQCSGGSYVDEATGSAVQLAAQHIMRSVTNTIGGSSITVNQIVTPLTEIAHRLARASGDLSSANMAMKAAEVADNFGLDNIDITQVQPTPLNAITGNTSDSDLYGIVLAAISQMQEDAKVVQTPPTGDELLSLITQIETDLNTTGFDSAVYTQSLTNLTSNSNTQSFITDITPISSLTEPSAATNVAPTANAGADQTVASAATVTLIGSGSDTDGTISSYSWSEAGGSNLTLATTSNPSLSFTVPSVSVDTTYTLQLTVTDNDGTTAIDDVAVTVLAVPAQYTVGGTVTGLNGSVTLQNNGADEIVINANGTFTFNTTYTAGSAYSVTIKSNSDNLLCELGNATGIVDQDITLEIHCISILNKLGELASGIPEQIAIQGDYAYLGTERGIYVVNISTPANITPVEYVGNLNVADMVISGNYLYAAISFSTTRMVVIDISDPSAPTIVNTQSRDAIGWASEITISGNYVYVLADSFPYFHLHNNITIYDVSSPDNPVVVGQFRVTAEATYGGVAVKGNYVYLADDLAGLKIVDISNPAEPTQVARIPMSELNDFNNNYAYSVVISGQYAYLNCDHDLFVFDISDPTNPIQAALYENVFPSTTTINGSYAYFYGSRRIQEYPGGPLVPSISLYVADISNSTTPKFIGSPTTIEHYSDVAISGNTMFFTHGSDGISAFDFSNPTNPSQISTYNTPAGARDITVTGNLLYVADNSKSGVNIIDATNVSSLQQIGSIYFGRVIDRVKVMGNYAYTPGGLTLDIIDVSIPQVPILQGQYSDKYLTLFDVEGNYVYALHERNTANAELVIIDVSDPVVPVVAGSLALPLQDYRYFYDFKYSNGLVYLSVVDGLMIFDVSDPGAPLLIGSYNSGKLNSLIPDAIDVQGQFAYMCNRSKDVTILDISNSASPQLASKILAGCNDIAVSGNSAYISTEDGIRVFDISDMSNIVESARYKGPEMDSPKISIANNKVYLAQYGHGIVIIEAFAQ